MVLWRISNHADLLGIGGILASARWHTRGRPIVYLAECPAAALLEVLVHLELDDEHWPGSYQLLKIEAEASVSQMQMALASMSSGWKLDEGETRSHGDAWLLQAQSALLKVPSAIAPETWNWLLNPRHADATAVRVLYAEKHEYDSRFFER